MFWRILEGGTDQHTLRVKKVCPYVDASLLWCQFNTENPFLIKPTETCSWVWWMSIMGAEGWVGCFCLSVTRVTKDICATCQKDMTQSILGDSPKNIPVILITGRIRDRHTQTKTHMSPNTIPITAWCHLASWPFLKLMSSFLDSRQSEQ